uniref:Periviscerokinin-1 n=14 Tax=Eumantodea TaxID=2901283 RepID=PVK1_BISPU|nr:RecName: Full=Periviscerokinin-1 [Bisanthe pulchripennis]P86648.1 RecName: Full=Periviscerokinin-1 [Chroicoptera sp. Windhoek]P86651.1 RecName: Full=Periviscerokinin-1 [Episcopomantis chalybea]P86653.1 RecName: Full=Periviscerokinin-1 [Gongylus gongylodes]P86655.1 RecName: Full=Periviscerokinin-1 [Hoplocoryphella grandis]P86657.1 RecName: Full=Periviscerokinin-1 [Hoplocorypha cf. macra RK-2010]P86661.1 RecName: Full=Periviscerokinin-1 [Miomantis paykullii]P86663.1 RecName: Full=Periviscer
QGLIPFPRV